MTQKIITTADLFNGVKALLRKAGKPDTPYGVAKFLGASSQAGYNWRDDLSVMDDEYGLKALKALNWDVEFGLACLAAERAARGNHTETAAAWHRIALRIATAASVAFLVVFFIFSKINPGA